MVSQNTICGEIKGSSKDWEFPEMAKKVPWACNKDKELNKDQSNEEITESDQTGKMQTKQRKLILISFNHRNGTNKTYCKEMNHEGRSMAGIIEREKGTKERNREGKGTKILTRNAGATWNQEIPEVHLHVDTKVPLISLGDRNPASREGQNKDQGLSCLGSPRGSWGIFVLPVWR